MINSSNGSSLNADTVFIFLIIFRLKKRNSHINFLFILKISNNLQKPEHLLKKIFFYKCVAKCLNYPEHLKKIYIIEIVPKKWEMRYDLIIDYRL